MRAQRRISWGAAPRLRSASMRVRKASISSRQKLIQSAPREARAAQWSRMARVSPCSSASRMACTVTAGTMPSCSRTRSSATRPAPAEMTRSRVVRASRMEPCPASARRRREPSSQVTPSCSQTCLSRASITGTGISRKGKICTRLLMVSGTSCSSVVASTNTAWAGGSSRILSRASKALRLIMWTSSMM